MKIEKINSNQIKCVLNKSDLTSRKIKVSELAYGTDKAQELFKDMMSQASDEFGFEANDVPLMIEAVPLSADSIMLIITKVDNPDDIEDKFSNLPVPNTRTFKKKNKVDTDVDNENIDNKEEVKDELIDVFYVYTFSNMDDISNATAKINDFTFTKSVLFKNDDQHNYYLAIVADNIPRWANRIIRGTLSEYGESIHYRHSALSYFEEHFETIVKDNAVNIMSQL
jgi:adapter protein MecA 1/2